MDGKPLLCLVSEQAPQEYLDALRAQGVSWIATGKNAIDLRRAAALLYETFGVRRMALVGGGTINGAFLAEGLIDEISLMIGAGVDGRAGQKCVFDGLTDAGREPVLFKLGSVERYPGTDTVWLRYTKRP